MNTKNQREKKGMRNNQTLIFLWQIKPVILFLVILLIPMFSLDITVVLTPQRETYYNFTKNTRFNYELLNKDKIIIMFEKTGTHTLLLPFFIGGFSAPTVSIKTAATEDRYPLNGYMRQGIIFYWKNGVIAKIQWIDEGTNSLIYVIREYRWFLS